MPFVKGQKRSEKAGRKKGVPNKKNTIFEYLEKIETEGGDQVDVVKLFFDGLMTMPPFQRVDALLKFMEFIFPKQKSLEIGNKDSEGFKIEIFDYGKK